MKHHNPQRHNMLPALSIPGFVLALGLVSCAVPGGVGELSPAPPPGRAPMAAARLGLAPALRPFYDELEAYGDWILVEPQGWVFRPRVNTVAWRPYQDGYWEPSYSFGWIWMSNEPFGWITDHYGFWFHDRFQGWVWQPFGAWAPSWVAWVEVGDFVGWAPLGPDGTTADDQVPGGSFTYVQATTLAQRSASSRASFVSSVPDLQVDVQPIERVASYRGVHWNAGPDPAAVLGPGASDRLRLAERDGSAPPSAPASPVRGEPRSLERTTLESLTRRAWNTARQDLRAARAVRAGGASGNKPRPDAHVAPADSLATPRPDSAAMSPGRRFLKPGAKRPGGPGNH